MNYFKSLAVVAIIFCVVPFYAQAQSSNVTSIVTRMDQIIKEMQSLKAEFDKLSNQVVVAPPGSVLGANTSKRLTKTPVFGETTEEISLIQKLLKTDPEIYPYGVTSGFFGPKTEEAIKNLQSRFKMNPVGVVGPSTTELLEAFFAKYPGDNFPADALKSDPRGVKPVVAGDSVSKPVTPTTPTTPVKPITNNTNIKAIQADMSEGYAIVAIYYKNDNTKEFKVVGDDEAEISAGVATKTGLTVATVESLIDFGGIDEEEIDGNDSDGDESDAEDAIDAAEEAIDEAQDEIDAADEDGDDVDWAEDTLKEAEDLLEEAEEAFDDEDWDEAIELAEEAEELAGDAEDQVGEEEKDSDADSIDKIEVTIVDDYAEVTVKYEDDDEDDYDFDINENDEDDIISAIAEELDLDEDEVEDLIEFDYGDLDSIDVDVDEDAGEAEVVVKYESGTEIEFTVDETDEDDIISAIADEIDEDESEIEDVIDFD